MYAFDKGYPPTFSKFTDPWNVPTSDLGVSVGRAAWDETTWEGQPNQSTKTDSHYDVEHRLDWAVTVAFEHFDHNTPRSLTLKRGYTKEQKEAIERSLGVKLNLGGGPEAFFKAEISASLKITNETRQEWTESSEAKEENKFAAGGRYVTWSLFQRIIVKRRFVRTEWEIFRFRQPDAPVDELNSIEVVISVFHDNDLKASKAGRHTFGESTSSLKAAYSKVVGAGSSFAPLLLSTYYAACEDGHEFWAGPERATYDEADEDAKSHDSSKHKDGTSHAGVINDLADRTPS